LPARHPESSRPAETIISKSSHPQVATEFVEPAPDNCKGGPGLRAGKGRRFIRATGVRRMGVAAL
jgi:hypothetical protein